MNILKQNKKAVTIEMSPVELEVLRSALIKEVNSRRKTWRNVEPKFPEELMYHAVMKDSAEGLKAGVYKGIKRYQEWGILQ